MTAMKRTLSILIALLTAASAFAACGEKAPDTAAPSAGAAEIETADENAGQAETTEVPAEYKAPDANYNGEVFTFLDYDTEDWFWRAASYSDIRAEEQNGDPINDAQYKRNLAVEELLGVKIETVKADSVDRQINGQMLDKFIAAGDASIDAAFVFGMNFASLMSDAGKLQNLLGLDTLNVSSSWWNQNFVSEMTLRGTLKGVTGSISIFNSFAPELYFFNKNMAESFGINDLYSLADSGQWTFDKAVEYSGLVASDIDGDGKMTENDRFGTAIQPALVLDCVLACGERLTKKDGDSIELALNTPRTAQIVEKVVPYLNDKHINAVTSMFSGYSNVFRQVHIPLFMNDQILFNFNQLLISIELRDMEADFGLLPLPKLDESQPEYHTFGSPWWDTILVVPAMNARHEITGHIFDALGYYSQQLVIPAFIDQTVSNKALRDEDSARMLNIVLGSQVYDIGYFYGWGDLAGMLNGLGSSNKTDFASAYAKVESKALAAMEKTLADLEG